jgi:ribonuclease HI
MKKRILRLEFTADEREQIRTGMVDLAGLKPEEGVDFSSENWSAEDDYYRVPVPLPPAPRPTTHAALRIQIDPVNAKAIRVFTDGSCVNNGKKNSKGGMGIHFPDGQSTDLSLPYLGTIPQECGDHGSGQAYLGAGKVTNQRAELTAIYVAISVAGPLLDDGEVIHVYTDSEYCINSLTNWCYTWRANEWKTANSKPVKNRDIIEPLLDLMRQYRTVFFHAAAHTDGTDARSRGNARADWLATQATARQQPAADAASKKRKKPQPKKPRIQ